MDNIAILNQLKAILGIDVEKNNPYRVPKGPKGGQFTSRRSGGGGAASAGSDKKPSGGSAGASGGSAKPTKGSMSETAAAKLRSEIEAGGGKRRNMDKNTVSAAYHSDLAKMDPFYKKDPRDGGAVYSNGAWSEKPPKGYPKDLPSAPRKNTNKEGDWDVKYKPPLTMTQMNNLRNMGANGQYALRVIQHELYDFAIRRQGKAVDSLEFDKTGLANYMKSKKLSTINWEVHHMLPSGKGGSNFGKNLAIQNGGEHTLSHIVEAGLNPIKTAKGGIKPGTLGVFPDMAQASAARAQNNTTKQLGSVAGYLRNAKFGKDGSKPMTPAAFKKYEAQVLSSKAYQSRFNIAVAAGAYRKGTKKLEFDRTGLKFHAPNGIDKIRAYLLKNPKAPDAEALKVGDFG
jgi:hypothetical protein